MSSELPGANGIMARIGRAGHACANACRDSSGVASAAADHRTNWRRVVMAGRFLMALASSGSALVVQRVRRAGADHIGWREKVLRGTLGFVSPKRSGPETLG